MGFFSFFNSKYRVKILLFFGLERDGDRDRDREKELGFNVGIG